MSLTDVDYQSSRDAGFEKKLTALQGHWEAIRQWSRGFDGRYPTFLDRNRRAWGALALTVDGQMPDTYFNWYRSPKNVSYRGSPNLEVSVARFPVLACLPADQLFVYSFSDFESVTDVARYELAGYYEGAPADDTCKVSWNKFFWDKYGSQCRSLTEAWAAVLYSCDAFSRPELAEDLRFFLKVETAAEELEELTRCYHKYTGNKDQIDRLVASNSRTDMAGRPDWDGIAEKVIKIVGGAGYGSFSEAETIIEMSRLNSASAPAKSSDGKNYELACADILRNYGYGVELTSASGDFGADIIATKCDRRYAIQCKDHARAVGVAAVQEAVAGKLHYLADFAVVVCEAGFTSAAHEFARTADVLLTTSSQLGRIDVSWA